MQSTETKVVTDSDARTKINLLVCPYFVDAFRMLHKLSQNLKKHDIGQNLRKHDIGQQNIFINTNWT